MLDCNKGNNKQATHSHSSEHTVVTHQKDTPNKLTHTHIKLDLGDKEEYMFDTESERESVFIRPGKLYAYMLNCQSLRGFEGHLNYGYFSLLYF